MDTTVVVIAVVVVLVVLVGVLLLLRAQRRRARSRQLREEFGPEYQHTVHARQGDRDAAEHDLQQRRERRQELQLRELDPERRREVADAWQHVQSRFVDEPAAAVAEGQSLVRQVMAERGYPVDEGERAVEDVSVDHPDVVQDYRTATRISEASAQGRASTEDLREAMVRYRALFERLLGTDDAGRDDAPAEGDRHRDDGEESTTAGAGQR